MQEPTGDGAPRRRVILFADLVESVRLYQTREAQTIDRWRRFVAVVRERVAPACHGRLVRTVGDGLLLDFERASEAVAAAFALHDTLATFNAPDAAADAMCLRIGLHVADVLVEDHDLFGAGVNLAARLATVAQPDETVASAELRGAIGDGVEADIRDLGLRYLKNLPEPVHAFALLPPGRRPGPHHLPPNEDLRPAIAVVPFVAMPADPEHDALGHAMADDLIASLSRHPGLRVLSRASTAAVRGSELALPRLRELLGASFLLSGRFYVRGARVRLSAELCELGQGQVLWTGSVSGDIDALFEGQDELVPHLVGQVSQHVMAHELSRVRALPMDSLASYSLLLGAGALIHSVAPSDFRQARPVLEHLSERHPRQAAPHALMSLWHTHRVVMGWTEDAQSEGELALAQAGQAMAKEPEQPGSLVAEGMALVFGRHDLERAGERFREALRRDPQHAIAWARLSEVQSEAGEHEEALRSVRRAIALSPLDPQRHMFDSYASRVLYMSERFDEAAQHARESIRRHALHAPAHRLLIAALWRAGQQDEARNAAQNYVRLMPEAKCSGSPRAPGAPPRLSPFAEVLRAAGVPA